jgi:hypothetical protein
MGAGDTMTNVLVAIKRPFFGRQYIFMVTSTLH